MAGDQLVRPGLTVRDARAMSASPAAARHCARSGSKSAIEPIMAIIIRTKIAGVRDLSPFDVLPRRRERRCRKMSSGLNGATQ